MHWSVFAVLEVVWVVLISTWIVLDRRSPAATLAWIFGLALLPVMGGIVYFFVGPRRLRMKHIRRALAREGIAAWTGGRRLAEIRPPRPDDPRHRGIVEVAQRCGEAPAVRAEETRLYFDGDECFTALLAAVAGAEHHVHLEYYIYDPGDWGRRIRDALIEKARAGVEVRLLVDAFGSNRLTRRFLRPLREAGAEVAFFNSFRLARMRPRLANFRTHRKIVVVDGRTAFTGGMNIADAHSVECSGEAAWRDTHLFLRGVAVLPLQLIFLEDWHYATGGTPRGGKYLPKGDLPAEGPFVQIVSSGPDQDFYPIHALYFEALGQARERAFVTTPYFVPDEAILAAIVGAARRGADVRVLVPRRADHFLARAAARSYYSELLDAGVRVFLYGPSMIHAKTLVVDQDISIVGTANLDSRSFRLNFEVVAAIYGEDPALQLAAQFERDLGRAEEVTSRVDSDQPILSRLVEGAARLFSPVL